MYKSKLIILFLFTLTITSLFSQRKLKYKNVYETLLKEGQEAGYPLLRKYLKIDSLHANTHYQLGLICHSRAIILDPHKNIEDIRFFYNKANLHFKICKSLINSKEARKHGEYYQSVKLPEGKTKIDETDIIKDIDQRQKKINYEVENNETIVKYFNKTVSFYNNCLDIFLEINKNYEDINDLYLIANDEFRASANELVQNFDSTQYYFEKYKKALKEFPIIGYNQKIKLKKIETYRLHGLYGSDFMKNNIDIWDYKTWRNEVFDILDNEIQTLRKRILKADNNLNNSIAVLNQNKKIEEKQVLYKLNNKLQYWIGKYDNNSILLKYLRYKQLKIDFLSMCYKPIMQTDDSTNFYSFESRCKHISDIVLTKKLIDSTTIDLKKNVNNYVLSKYSEYITNNFKDSSGFVEHIDKEIVSNDKILKEVFGKLEYFLKNYRKIEFPENFAKYKNQKIPLFVDNTPLANEIKYIPSDFFNDTEGNIYIAGRYLKNETEQDAFVAKMYDNKNIGWLKTFNIKSSDKTKLNDNIELFNTYEDGSIFIVSSMFESDNISKMKNTIIKLNSKGNKIYENELNSPYKPQYFNYDDINENTMILYNKNHENKDESYISLIHRNIPKDSINWQTNINLKGEVVDIIKIENQFQIIANCNYFKSNNKVIIDDDMNNILVVIIDDTGKIEKYSYFKPEKRFHVHKAIKINNNSINIIGIDVDGNLAYLLIDSNGEKTFCNYKK